MNENAELLNGRVAMLGIIAAIGAYCLTGDIIPGIFWLVSYDWTLLQTLIFIITPYFLMLALASKDEDDDDGGPGMLQPMGANWSLLLII